MEVARDLLDQQLLDRRRRRVGKIDGLVLEIEDGSPPRVIALEVGAMTLGRRLPGAIGKWMIRAARRFGLYGGQPYRIPWGAVSRWGIDVELDLDAADTPLLAWERWLRDRFIGRIPGA